MMTDRLELLREALPYIQKFKAKIFVVKLSGKVTEDPTTRQSLAEEIALCHQVGIHIIVVHGGGNQVTHLARRLGVEQRIILGRRVTDDETLELAKMIFAGKINTEVAAALYRSGVPTVGLTGFDGYLVRARRREPQRLWNPTTGREETVDYGHVGDVEAVNGRLLRLLMENGYLPVVCCLAADDQGNIVNINADTIAAELAADLDAEKLVLLTDVDGLFLRRDDPTTKLSHLTRAELEELLASGYLTEGMLPKADAILRLLARGRTTVHIINGCRRNALLQEIFTDAGSGTMIRPT
jgi:acetylglutamate kinase